MIRRSTSTSAPLLVVYDEETVLEAIEPLDARVQVLFPLFCCLRLEPAFDLVADVSDGRQVFDDALGIARRFATTGERPSNRAVRLLARRVLAVGVQEESHDGVFLYNALVQALGSASAMCDVARSWDVRSFLVAQRGLLDLHAAVVEDQEALRAASGPDGAVLSVDAAGWNETVVSNSLFQEVLRARAGCLDLLRGGVPGRPLCEAVEREAARLPTTLWRTIGLSA